MDAISYSYADKQAKRIKRFIENPDSTSGIVTVPKVIASGETITIPAGRVAILPNVQIDGVLNIENGGEVFIPSGATFGGVVEKVTSTDNAIVRFNGTTGAVQNSSVLIDDNGQMISSLAGVSTIAYTFGGQQAGTGVSCPANGILGLNSLAGVLVYGSGGLGYGTGSGGTVTQLTSKSTAVTLNKPTGQITMNNAALAAGATIYFLLNNTLITAEDIIITTIKDGTGADVRLYRVEAISQGTTFSWIKVTNTHSSSLSESIVIKYAIIKGANS